ncbi:MAG: hypothetical protein K5888_08090, partial [Lachnospiraceae bacterium]|nr:hypothetical protein [Lachnospiraceae bacterium]
IEEKVKAGTKKYRVKSRNFKKEGVILIFEIVTGAADVLAEELAKTEGVVRYSLMEYDPDDVL